MMLLTMGYLNDVRALLTPDDMNVKENREVLLNANQKYEFTHYMICSMNRLRIKQEDIKYTEDDIFFTVLEQVNEFDWHEHTFRIPSVMGGQKIKILIDGPIVTLINEDNQKEVFSNVFLFLEFLNRLLDFSGKLSDILKLNVKYIGQTELNEKYIRFEGHEKVLKMTSNIIAKNPNKDAWILLLSFKKPFINAVSIPEVESNYRSDWLPEGELLNNLPKEHWKNIVEGTMIHYFKPILNRNFTKNFPSNKHSSYSYFYEKNIRSIIVELRGEYMPYTLGNENVSYTHSKIIEYALNKDDLGILINDNLQEGLDELIDLLT